MMDLSKNRAIKLIALFLSLLLIFESVAWADPDLFSRQDLQPRMFFDPSDAGTNPLLATTGMIIKYMAKFETDPKTRNLFSIGQCAQTAIDELKRDKALSAAGLESTAKVAGSPEEGNVTIDLGACCIRYYNPRMEGADEPGFPCKIIEDVKIGEYLSRQVLTRETAGHGYIAKGDPKKLYDALTSSEKPLKELRKSVKDRLAAISTKLRQYADVLRFEGNDYDYVLTAADSIVSLNMVEFGSVVIRNKLDPSNPEGWLLGFNTARVEGNFFPETPFSVGGLLGSSGYPDTIGLSSDVLDIIEKDDLILAEYIFHEAACPYFGHEKTRKIQEKIFSSNYAGIHGDSKEGHADGELTVALKKVIWKGFAETDTSRSDEGKDPGKFEEFKKLDFRAQGPQKASYFFGSFKRFYEPARRRLLYAQSRLVNKDREKAGRLLVSLEKTHDYIFAKLSYIWAMEAAWAPVNEIGGWQGISDISEENLRKVKPLLAEVIRTHEKFMNENPLGKYLKGDTHIEDVIGEIRSVITGDGGKSFFSKPPAAEVVGGTSSPAPATPVKTTSEAGPAAPGKTAAKKPASIEQSKSAKQEVEKNDPAKPEAKKEAKKEVKKETEPPMSWREMIKNINWKRVAVFYAAALALAGVLYLVLPVTWFTVMIGWVLPLAIFVYMIVKYWSWKNLAIGVATTIILSYLLPVPWLGLSMSLVFLAQIAMSGKKQGKGGAMREEGRGKREEGRGEKDERRGGKDEGGRTKDEGRETEDGSQGAGRVEQGEKTHDAQRTTQDGSRGAGREARGQEQDVFKRLAEKEKLVEATMTEAQRLEMERRVEIFKEMRKHIDITDDILVYMVNIIAQRHRANPAPRSQIIPVSEVNTRTFLDNIFITDILQAVPDHSIVKKELKRIVYDILESPEMAYSFELAPVMRTMRDWKGKKNIELSAALRKLYEEVSGKVNSKAVGEELLSEVKALQELICEFFGMDRITTLHVRQGVALLGARETVASGKVIGFVTPQEYYVLGRAEFFFLRDATAEEAFETAVKVDPENKDYLLTLGIVKHFLKKFDDAGLAYKRSLEVRNKEKEEATKKGENVTDVEDLKIGMLKLLSEKAAKKVPLSGEKLGRGDRISTAAMRWLKKIIAPGMPFEKYAAKLALRVEDVIFNVIPLVAVSVLMAVGKIDLMMSLMIMGCVYALFAALHADSMLDAAVKDAGFWGSFRYAFSSPVLIGGLTYAVNAGFLSLLSRVLEAELSFYAVGAMIVLLAGVSYRIASVLHRDVNQDLIGTKEEGRGTSEEGRRARDEGRRARDEGREKRDEGRGKREEGRETKEDGRGREDRTAVISKNAEKAIPELVNALITASRKNEKTVLALDLSIGDGEVNSMLRELVKILPTLEDNNGDLKRFFQNLEIVKGEGAALARRIDNLTAAEKGSVKPENVIIITKGSLVQLYGTLEGKATIAGIDDKAFPDNAYLPLLEIMLFAVGKHLGWDAATLKRYYATIPNVVLAGALSEDEAIKMFEGGGKTFLFRLIPNAERFKKEELRELMDGLRVMLARA